MSLAYATPCAADPSPEVTASLPGSHTPGPGEPSIGRFRRTCPECGESFRTTFSFQEFCSTAHKREWNNRRAFRGAVVFDLFMALRHERGVAKALRVWSLLCRLSRHFREEDERERGGRKSWRDPHTVIAERPWLHAIVLHRNINPKKPGSYIR